MSISRFSHPPFSSDADQTHPWLLVSQGKNLESHTFYDPSKNQYFKRNIPELRNKYVSLASYGWLALIDVGKVPLQCCLFNTTSKQKIRLPRIRLDEYPEPRSILFYECVLSKPPGDDDPDCHVMFLFPGSIFFCRLGDKKFVEKSTIFGDDLLSGPTSLNGKIYAWMDASQIFVEIDFGGGREFILKPLVDDRGLHYTWPSPLPSPCYSDYLLEFYGELLLVHKSCNLYGKVKCFRILKVNTLEKTCTELMNIGDHAIFVGSHGCKLALCSNESGVKRNSIYYYKQNIDRKLYVYDIEERSKTLVKPCRFNWDENPCSWNGITCKEQRVVSVSIPKKKLSGFLSYSLGSLSELRHVNLRNNKLSGILPSELFKAQGLQSLVLYGNLFNGSLPFEVGNLQYLQTLDLSQNFFSGSLPTSLIECKRLRNLDFSQNNFSGPLPNGIGKNLVLLEKLDLSFNGFSGSIPGDLGYLSNLQGTLDLSHNMFNGSIPASLGNLPEKVYIDLTYNELSGPIPQNGALVNRGPTAFIGNPGLCGPPLKNLCSSNSEASSPSTFPYLPDNHPPEGGGKVGGGRGLSKATLIAIIVGDVIGICVIGLLFSYCYSRVCGCGKRKDENGYGFEKGGKRSKECFCFRKDESETLSENVEQYDLVALDAHVAFDLDELLKASAFVLGKSGIGIVYKVVLEDGLTLAVRRLGEGGSQRFKEFQTEVEAIGKLRHPNIATLKAYYWSVDEKLLIYDFIPNGNLATAIHGKPGLVEFLPISWSIRLKIMKGVAKGLVYLHEYSPKKYGAENLDFGLGRLANITGGGSPTVQSNHLVSDKPQRERQSSSASEVATFASASSFGSYYQAPEALKVVKPSQKWDIYSYGVILLEMITGKSPLVQVGNSEMDIVHWMQLCIEEKKPVSDVLDPNLAQDADKEEEMIAVLKIAMACTQSSPEKRPSMRHVSDALEKKKKK
ncbi:hypothetical protein DH2020_011886 [Rehmannia glutinosa]|uniref:Protein kinase domain-containing protein n=1 Tax=Rehmannia glutinosa TaxID=99300 RepID=A0ABR0XEN5_REHGL